MLRKVVELPFVPMPGMKLVGIPWKGEREVKAVTFSSEAPYAVVAEVADVGPDQEGSVEAYTDNEWTIA